MAFQYYVNKGEEGRTKVLSLTHSYHGDTFKAMEVGDDEDYHFAFKKKENVIHIPTRIQDLRMPSSASTENFTALSWSRFCRVQAE